MNQPVFSFVVVAVCMGDPRRLSGVEFVVNFRLFYGTY